MAKVKILFNQSYHTFGLVFTYFLSKNKGKKNGLWMFAQPKPTYYKAILLAQRITYA